MPHRVKKPKNVAIVDQFDRLDRAVQHSLHKELFVAALHFERLAVYEGNLSSEQLPVFPAEHASHNPRSSAVEAYLIQ